MEIGLVNNIFLFFGLMVLAKEDHESLLISNKKLLVLVLFRLFSDVISLLYSYNFNQTTTGPIIQDLYLHLFLALTVTLVLFIFAIFMPQALGMGDVKLIGTLILYLGTATFLLLFLSFVLLLIRAVLLKLRKTKADKLPLAPSVFAAYTILLLLIYI